MQLGISSYTFTWAVGVPGSLPPKPYSAYDLIDKASASVVNLVQIADNLPLENMSASELENLLSYARNKNVSIEMGGRGLTTENTYSCLKAAETLQSPILRMVIDREGFEPDLNSIIGIVRDLLHEFESRNIRLAIENHDRFKARDFEKIIQSVGSEWAGICLDSVNSMGAGEGFETASEILLPYTINLHIKDFTIYRVSHKMGLIIEGRPAGKGMLKIKDTVERLMGLNRCQSAILELWTPPELKLEDTIEKEDQWACESIEYLKELFKVYKL
jgi:sugar phosphate isomerase/epimerase